MQFSIGSFRLAMICWWLVMGFLHPALAHRPYFTTVQETLLPDGTVGEIRLLNGDGIIASDPVRALLLDSNKRLLAQSRETRAMVFSCLPDRSCRAFDITDNLVLEPDPASFQAGPIVSPGTTVEFEDPILVSNAEWGFRQRIMTWPEFLEGQWLFAGEKKGRLLFYFCWAALGWAFLCFGNRRPPRGALAFGLWAFLLASRILIAGLIFCISLVLAELDAVTNLWPISVILGFLLVVSIKFFFRWKPPIPTPA